MLFSFDFLNSTGYVSLFFISLIAIVLCYEESEKFRYKFKFSIYIIIISFISLITIPYFIFRPRDPLNVYRVLSIVRPINPLLGVEWIVRGEEILDEDQACIVVANHQSVLDFLGMIRLWGTIKRLAAVAKSTILYIFPFGITAWLCGTIFINRAKSKESQVTLSLTSKEIKKSKIKLWIFAEGTRSKGATLKQFKKGAFHIAYESKLSIVPVVYSPYNFVNDEQCIFNSGKAIMSVLKPISPFDENGKERTVNEMCELTWNLMNEEYVKLSKEVEKITIK